MNSPLFCPHKMAEHTTPVYTYARASKNMPALLKLVLALAVVAMLATGYRNWVADTSWVQAPAVTAEQIQAQEAR
jgi:hypothetical protein